MQEVQVKLVDSPTEEVVPHVPLPLQPRVSGGGLNSALLQMFDDLYDPNNEEGIIPEQEP